MLVFLVEEPKGFEGTDVGDFKKLLEFGATVPEEDDDEGGGRLSWPGWLMDSDEAEEEEEKPRAPTESLSRSLPKKFASMAFSPWLPPGVPTGVEEAAAEELRPMRIWCWWASWEDEREARGEPGPPADCRCPFDCVPPVPIVSPVRGV